MSPEEAVKKTWEFAEFTEARLPKVPHTAFLQQGKKEMKAFGEVLVSLEPRNLGLEIGFAFGGSHFFWRLFFEEMISMDINNNSKGLLLPLFEEYGCDMSKSVFVMGDSTDPQILDEMKQLLGARELDFLFIDGGHDYGVMKSDFENYMPLVRKDGIIAMHDAGNGIKTVESTQKCGIALSQKADQYGVSKFTFVNIDHGGIAWCTKL